MRAELESLQQRQRALKEDLAEKEGQLRVAKMNLQTAQKQSQHHAQEVTSPTPHPYPGFTPEVLSFVDLSGLLLVVHFIHWLFSNVVHFMFYR